MHSNCSISQPIYNNLISQSPTSDARQLKVMSPTVTRLGWFHNLMPGPNYSDKLDQYHACWCPGSWHCQVLSIHDILTLWNWDILVFIELIFSVPRNARKWESKFMLFKKNSACKVWNMQNQNDTHLIQLLEEWMRLILSSNFPEL